MKIDPKDQIMMQIKGQSIPMPELEYRFHPKRKWRFDYAWPDRMIALEFEGGVWTGGRHNRSTGFNGDCEKYSIAGLMGWTVMRVTIDHVQKGILADWLDIAFNGGKIE